MEDISALEEALQRFASGAERSKQLADRIEGILISDQFREESTFDNLRDMLASFSPNGGVSGERLYDEDDLAKECAATLKSLKLLASSAC